MNYNNNEKEIRQYLPYNVITKLESEKEKFPLIAGQRQRYEQEGRGLEALKQITGQSNKYLGDITDIQRGWNFIFGGLKPRGVELKRDATVNTNAYNPNLRAFTLRGTGQVGGAAENTAKTRGLGDLTNQRTTREDVLNKIAGQKTLTDDDLNAYESNSPFMLQKGFKGMVSINPETGQVYADSGNEQLNKHKFTPLDSKSLNAKADDAWQEYLVSVRSNGGIEAVSENDFKKSFMDKAYRRNYIDWVTSSPVIYQTLQSLLQKQQEEERLKRIQEMPEFVKGMFGLQQEQIKNEQALGLEKTRNEYKGKLKAMDENISSNQLKRNLKMLLELKTAGLIDDSILGAVLSSMFGGKQ